MKIELEPEVPVTEIFPTVYGCVIAYDIQYISTAGYSTIINISNQELIIFVIRNDCYRSDPSIPWSFDLIKSTTDPALAEVKASYLKFEEMTQDLTHGWHQQIIRPADPCHIYYYDIFGPHVTEEAIRHVNHLYRLKYLNDFAGPWYKWSVEHRHKNGITLERKIVQISNPNAGSNSWALDSYPA